MKDIKEVEEAIKLAWREIKEWSRFKDKAQQRLLKLKLAYGKKGNQRKKG